MKSFIISLFTFFLIVGLYPLVTGSTAEANVPDVKGFVKDDKGLPVAGVWLEWTDNIENQPVCANSDCSNDICECIAWRELVNAKRYEQTGADGSFRFSSWQGIGGGWREKKYETWIDHDLNPDTPLVRQSDISMYTGFGCGENPHRLRVVKPTTGSWGNFAFLEFSDPGDAIVWSEAQPDGSVIFAVNNVAGSTSAIFVYTPSLSTCLINLSATQTLISVGQTSTVVASVTLSDGNPDEQVASIEFSSDNAAISLNPTTITPPVYSTSAQAMSVGRANVTATARLKNGGSCISQALELTVTFKTNPWFQTQGGDVHSQNDIISPIPEGVSDNNFSRDLFSYPGVVSYRGASVSFSKGQVSTKGWLANDSLLPKKANFTYFYQKLEPILLPCEGNSCLVVTAGKTNAYYTTADLIIDKSWSIPANTKVVILVAGNLNLALNPRERFVVPTNSFLAFFVRGNINIDGGTGIKEVGQIEPFLQGVYLTDGTLNTYASDLGGRGDGFRFIGAGLFYGGKAVTLGRNLGSPASANPSLMQNANTPAELFIFRPDLVLNSPVELWSSKMTWFEVAP